MTPTAEASETTSVGTSAAGEGRSGVEALLRQLGEQKQATIRAIQSTLAVEKLLTETRQELNRALMIASVPPDPPPSEAGQEGKPQPEAVLQQAQQQLETERQARNDDRVQAAARIARLEATVANVEAREKTAMKSLRRSRLLWGLVTAALILLVAVITHFAARYQGTAMAEALKGAAGGEKTAQIETPAAAAQDSGDRPRVPERALIGEPGTIAPQSALENAVARMSHALAAFPDAKPEQIIESLKQRRLDVDPSSCLVAWNEGQPELLVQDRIHDRMKIARTLSDCASAIEDAQHTMVFGRSAK
jgi:hypothetical protein